MQFPGKYCKIKLQEEIDMKKVLTLSIIFALLITGECFAEKSKLKKKTWTPVQTRVENSIEVQDSYNHM